MTGCLIFYSQFYTVYNYILLMLQLVLYLPLDCCLQICPMKTHMAVLEVSLLSVTCSVEHNIVVAAS